MNKEFKVGDIVVLVEGVAVVLVEGHDLNDLGIILAKEKHLFEVTGWVREYGYKTINLRSIRTRIKIGVYEESVRHATLKEQYLRNGNSVVIDGIGYLVSGNIIIGLKGVFTIDYFRDDLLTMPNRSSITKVFNNPSGKFEDKIDENHVLTTILWERKPKIKLTSDEVIILKNLNEKYKHIARDKDRLLAVYETEPMKSDIHDNYFTDDDTEWECLDAFYHLFQNITFESGAHSISDLIKENEK